VVGVDVVMRRSKTVVPQSSELRALGESTNLNLLSKVENMALWDGWRQHRSRRAVLRSIVCLHRRRQFEQRALRGVGGML
jgi:hypothetical protein